MPAVASFYSINEVNKPIAERVYHNNSTCPPGRNIKAAGAEQPGKNAYRPCKYCAERNGDGR